MEFEQDIYPNFSLDMVSTDMNFEQAYNMYNDLQQENALSAVENLQKLQSTSLFTNPHDASNNTHNIKNEMENDESEDEEYQKFFSNTESNALEKFLDNLANSNNVNPLELYNYNFNFKPKNNFTGEQDDIQFKKTTTHDFTNAFSHPPAEVTQLPTPESRQSSIDEEFEYPSQKRKRSSFKPLLSLEQKRLNHSHSEQKRRKFCKLAYERCLRLVTNFETYKKNPPINKKSKRKQFNKDGLPNLSKYCALNKIANEMIKIKAKNDELKRLLNI